MSKINREEVLQEIQELADRFGTRTPSGPPEPTEMDLRLAEWTNEPILALSNRASVNEHELVQAEREVKARFRLARQEAISGRRFGPDDPQGVGAVIRAALKAGTPSAVAGQKPVSSVATSPKTKPATPTLRERLEKDARKRAAEVADLHARIRADRLAHPPQPPPARKPETPADLAAQIVRTARAAGAIK